MLMSRIVALALASATAQAQNLTPGLIAGYHALTEVDDYLEKDLVQQELERLMENEDCVSFEAGRKFYYNIQADEDKDSNFPDGGEYLATIPTYGNAGPERQSKEYKEYIQWAGGNPAAKNFHKQWVNAAFNKGDVLKGEMKADFSVFPNDPFCPGDCECVGFEEVVKKATSYVYNFLEVVQLMQASIESAKDDCIYQQDSCKTAVKYWDASVAIYVGSLEGEFGRSSTGGKSNYALANKRCRNFKNCGAKRDEGNSKDRISPVNTKILAYFSAGQHAAFAGDYALMEDYKKLISAKMVVPWIQGTLRYAWRLSSERSRLDDNQVLFSNTDPLDANEVEQQDPKLPFPPIDPPANDADYSVLDKEVGEAAAFALGAVPKLWACDVNAAKYVWSQLGPGQGRAGAAPVNFQLVKLAFECNYKCLLTSCEEVGALYDGVDKQGLIGPSDSDDTIDGKVDVRNGAKKCNGNQLGVSPKGYAKCRGLQNSIQNGKCKFLTGTPGIGSGNSARDKLQYFQTTTP